MASSRDGFYKAQQTKNDKAPITKASTEINPGPTNRTFHKILENVYKPGFIDDSTPEKTKMSVDRELGEISKALFKTSERDAHNIRVVNNLQLQTGNFQAQINDVRRLSTEGDAALAQAIFQVVTDYETADTALHAAVTAEETARTDADSALATRVSTVEASLGSGGGVDAKIAAAVRVEETARVAADGALGQRITTVDSAYKAADAALHTTITGETSAAVKTEETARTAADTALGTRIDTVTADYKSADTALHTAVTTETTAAVKVVGDKVTKIETKWSVTLDANGYISGLTMMNDSQTSKFSILADQFIVNNKAGTDVAPFEIVGGVVKIKNAQVGDIHSDNYAAGSAGWSITKAGNAEFNNVTVRGHITATSFSGFGSTGLVIPITDATFGINSGRKTITTFNFHNPTASPIYIFVTFPYITTNGAYQFYGYADGAGITNYPTNTIFRHPTTNFLDPYSFATSARTFSRVPAGFNGVITVSGENKETVNTNSYVGVNDFVIVETMATI